MGEGDDLQFAGLGVGFLGAELADEALDAGEVFLGGGDDETAGVWIGDDAGVGGGGRGAGGGLGPVELFDEGEEAFGFLWGADLDESGLEGDGLGGAGFELGDDVGGDLDIVQGAGDHDRLGGAIDGDGGGGGGGAVGGAAGEGLGEDGGDVGDLTGARSEDAGELDGSGLVRGAAGGEGGGGAAALDGALVDAGDELLDLFELAGDGSGDDEAVLLGVGDDAGLGGGVGGGFVGASDGGDGLADDVGQFLGFDGLGVIDADVPGGAVLLFELVDQLFGEGEAFVGAEEDEGSGGFVVDGGDVVLGIRRENVHSLGVGIEGGPFWGGGEAEGPVEEIGDDGAGRIEERVGAHLAFGGLLVVEGGEEGADALDVGETVGDDEAAAASEGSDGAGIGEHGGDRLGDLAGVEAVEVEDDGDDVTGADLTGGVGAAEDGDGEGAEVLEGDEAELVAGVEEHDPLHGEDQVERLDGLWERVGDGVVVGEGADDVGVGEERLAGHLGEAFEDIGVGDAIELEPDVAGGVVGEWRGRGLAGDDDLTVGCGRSGCAGCGLGGGSGRLGSIAGGRGLGEGTGGDAEGGERGEE